MITVQRKWLRLFYLLRLAPFFCALVLPSAAGAGILSAGGAWVAIDRGASCEALTRSLRVATKDKVQPLAGLTFGVDGRRWAEFHARLSRMPRGDASVMLKIGDQPFLLVTRNGWAWKWACTKRRTIVSAT